MSLIVLGGINLDIICSVEELPAPGETVSGLAIDQSPGGKGLNQAIAIARLGGEVQMLGAVGCDPEGDGLIKAMALAGVSTGQVRRMPDSDTGRAFITLSNAGENMIVVHAGANLAFGAEDVEQADLGGAQVFLTQFEAALPAVRTFFSTPQARGGVRILNTAPALDAGRDLLPLADILVMNEIELQRFANLDCAPMMKEDIVTAARWLLRDEAQSIIVTLGGDGAVLVTAAGAKTVPAIRQEVVDTIGAGDCFCGALAFRIASGDSIERAMGYATAAAGISVARRGGASSMPNAAEVEALLASEGAA
ncbi:hypothetical protein MB02_07620 [Croceicoccus estronivorus]|uniref:ribokinase n=1 Tax=Croceicoccus estronivorus TaxID=1172626 RepID=UPI00082E13F6|nr:ribokinase [Croceicoccus estronivorus]OCC24436.1 hypothetical protein MB02_07620 [Croceicoccus estronivorus]